MTIYKRLFRGAPISAGTFAAATALTAGAGRAELAGLARVRRRGRCRCERGLSRNIVATVTSYEVAAPAETDQIVPIVASTGILMVDVDLLGLLARPATVSAPI
jgi:hypothetical protein